MDHRIQSLTFGQQDLGKMPDIGFLCHIAREYPRSAELIGQLLDSVFLPVTLVSQDQVRAFAAECLRNGVSDTPPVSEAENQGALVLQKLRHEFSSISYDCCNSV